MDGIVTRRNIEEGETAVVGTMNNAGTVLLTIADMSVIEAEVEVDETDIPSVRSARRRRVTIDAVPNRTFTAASPRSATARFRRRGRHAGHRPAAGHQLQGGGDARRTDPRREAGLHVHGRDHDRDPAASRWLFRFRRWPCARCSSTKQGNWCASRPRARRRGTDRSRRCRRSTEPPPGHSARGRGRVRRPRRASRVRAGQGGHRRRALLRGAVGLNAGRPVITGPFASVRELRTATVSGDRGGHAGGAHPKLC
jgi:hypothetical protein